MTTVIIKKNLFMNQIYLAGKCHVEEKTHGKKRKFICEI